MTETMKVQTEIIPSYAVLTLQGPINTFAEEPIEDEIRRLQDMKCPAILLDFTEVDHINSAGITILIGAAGRVRDNGGRLAAFGLSDHYRKIFLMVGLEEFILLGKDRAGLLKQLGVPVTNVTDVKGSYET